MQVLIRLISRIFDVPLNIIDRMKTFNSKTIIIIMLAVLASVCLFTGCGRQNFTEEKDEYGFIIRTYYDDNNRPVAESFGYKIDDYRIDIDDDGKKEYICNCEYGADGHREVFVYKDINGVVCRGSVCLDEIYYSDLNDYGANAVQSYYDSKKEAIVICYASLSGEWKYVEIRDYGEIVYGLTFTKGF